MKGVKRVDRLRLKQLVCFAILMENGRGVLDKSPDYLVEKYQACVTSSEPEVLLDSKNLQKFFEYEERWQKLIQLYE